MKPERAQESWAGLRPKGSMALVNCQGARTRIYSAGVYWAAHGAPGTGEVQKAKKVPTATELKVSSEGGR